MTAEQEPQHVVFRLSNSQVALLAAAMTTDASAWIPKSARDYEAPTMVGAGIADRMLKWLKEQQSDG